MLKLTTTYGNIVVETDTIKAPITSKNFLRLAEGGSYSDSKFYRTVKQNNQSGSAVKIKVIQGGLFADSLIERFPVIVHENTARKGLFHKNGVVSMARNEPGTASTEFFICIGNQPELDYGGKRNPDGDGLCSFWESCAGHENSTKNS